MDYTHKYRLFPDGDQREQLDWVRDTVRQLYNHIAYYTCSIHSAKDPQFCRYRCTDPIIDDRICPLKPDLN
ncbi:helix-turn-helix domain-containing protein [Halorientalis marina]|uniref:helix-turn-helix domain-containing protein n=1 Tax=Halorientalis marina TaxID=2931976 RepID=UPI0035670B99